MDAQTNPTPEWLVGVFNQIDRKFGIIDKNVAAARVDIDALARACGSLTDAVEQYNEAMQAIAKSLERKDDDITNNPFVRMLTDLLDLMRKIESGQTAIMARLDKVPGIEPEPRPSHWPGVPNR